MSETFVKRPPPMPLLPKELRHLLPAIPPIPAKPYRLTDAGHAEFFANLFVNVLRYNKDSEKWHVWMGHFWAEDRKETRLQSLVIYASELRIYQAKTSTAETDADEKFRDGCIGYAMRLQSRSKIQTVIDLASKSPLLATEEKEWNKNNSLLAVHNGVLELPTADKALLFRPGRPADMLSRFLPIDYDVLAKCPRFERFLTDSLIEPETREFVHKALGYSLTGDISEQVVFFCIGEGNNGKSVLLSTIATVLGDYADRLDLACLDEANSKNIPNDIAALAGRRFIVGSETRQGGGRLNEAKLKMLTGETELRGRFLNREFFNFKNQVKLWISMNHLPQITDTSIGYWRRCRPIHFSKIIASGNVDKHLEDKLKLEAAGILNWLLAGCKLWHEKGLAEPESMRKITETYRKNSDTFGQFLSDCCVFAPDARVPVADLTEAITSWCKQNGEKVFSQRSRNTYLEKLKCERVRGVGGVRYWCGLKLIPAQPIGDGLT